MDPLHGPEHDTLRTPRRRQLSPRIGRPTYFVRLPLGVAVPEPAMIETQLRRWLMRELCGWLQLVVVELLTDGHVSWTADVVVDPRRVGSRLLAVSCVDRPGPRRPGLWAALSVAYALAELLGGAVIDPRRGPLSARLRAPPADGRVRAIEHLSLPSSVGARGARWIASVGMVQFGLPELELVAVPEAVATRAASLLLGAAQQLIDARPSVASPRELLLTIGELHWALGGDADTTPISNGRGWTRVGLDLGRERAGVLVMRLRPPVGARSWQGSGAWVRDAHFDLYGPSKKSDD